MPELSEDENSLINSAQNGDINAFNQLVLRYQDALYTLAYRLMGDPASAGDMTQDALITAYRRLDTFRGGNFRAWLMRITTNTCYDELRRHKRRPIVEFDDLAGADNDDGPPLPADTPLPEEMVMSFELQTAIQQCIDALKDDQRVVLVMADVEGFSYQDIAESVDVQMGTVKSRLSRARVAMRHCLQGVRELLPSEYRL